MQYRDAAEPSIHDHLAIASTRSTRFSPGFWLAVLALFAMSACGGGGGGGGTTSSAGGGNGGSTPPAPAPQPTPTGSVAITISDDLAAPVTNATVTVTVFGQAVLGATSHLGVTTLENVPVGDGEIGIVAEGFEPSTQPVTVEEDQKTDVVSTLVRITEPAAGVAGVELTEPLASTDGQTISFSIDVLVINDDPTAPSTLDSLTEAAFTLQPCANDDPDRVECLRVPGLPQADIGYSVVNAAPENFSVVPRQPPLNYAAASTIDQSGSIADNDPSDARLYAHKLLLTHLGAGNTASISAFAQEGGGSGPALIADEPITRLSNFIEAGDAESLYGELDSLAALEGGGTPLFAAIDAELDYTAANAPAGIERKAVVVFTDGDDTICDPPSTGPCGVEVSTQKSQDLGVDIFTVGLGTNLSVSRLQSLAFGGNGVFLYAANPEQLTPTYRALNELLSGSQASYRMQWTITADEPATYVAGRIVYGTLTVDTGSNIIDLPIRVFL